MSDYVKPLPIVDVQSKPFWSACNEERLVIQQCKACGTNRFPATHYCANCQSDSYDWVESSGKGKVFSWIIVNHPVPGDIWGDAVPYAVGLIELDEGVRMVSNIIDCDHKKIVGDMRVEVTFEQAGDEFKLPKFKPAQ